MLSCVSLGTSFLQHLNSLGYILIPGSHRVWWPSHIGSYCLISMSSLWGVTHDHIYLIGIAGLLRSHWDSGDQVFL
jgi:hypothetical protein